MAGVVVMLILSSCISQRLRPDNYSSILDKKGDEAFVYFQSEFSNGQYSAPGWKIRLQVYQKGKNGFVTDFSDRGKTDYLYHLKPGTYTIRRFEYVSSDGSTRIGVLPLDQKILLQAGQITYLGDLFIYKQAWATNAGAGVMPPFTFMQAGMARQQLSVNLAAGWTFEWRQDPEQAQSNINSTFPELRDLPLISPEAGINHESSE